MFALKLYKFNLKTKIHQKYILAILSIFQSTKSMQTVKHLYVGVEVLSLSLDQTCHTRDVENALDIILNVR